MYDDPEDDSLNLSLGDAYPSVQGDFPQVVLRARRHKRSRRLANGFIAVVLLVGVAVSSSVLTARSSPQQTGPLTASTLVLPKLPDIKLHRSFLRSSSDGVSIRAYVPSGANVTGQAPNGTPVAPSSLEVELATASGITDRTPPIPPDLIPGNSVSSAPIPPNVGPGNTISSAIGFEFGIAGDSGIFGVVHTAPQVREVRMTLPDGSVDEMTPVNGWSVLAHQSDATQAAIEALDSTGAPIATATIAIGGGSGPNWAALFVRRTSDGVLIRGGKTDTFLIPNVSNAGTALLFEGVPACSMPNPNSLYVVPQDPAGAAEGSPLVAVPVQSGPNIARVTVTFSDGYEDSMSPVQGVAILAHQGVSKAVTVTGLDGSGQIVAHIDIASLSLAGIPPCPTS
jgi:hypothetical protein